MTKNDQAVPNSFYAPTLLPVIDELIQRGVAEARIEACLRRSLFEWRTPFLKAPLFLSRRFWDFAVQASGDAEIGLSAGQRFASTLTNGLTHLFDAAESLESACAYCAAHFPYFNGHYRAELVEAGELVELQLHEQGTLKGCAPLADYLLVGIAGLIRRKLAASGYHQEPIHSILLPADHPLGAHRQVLRAPLELGGRRLGLRLHGGLFRQSLTPGNAELEQALVALLQQAEQSSRKTLLDQVAEHVCTHLAESPSLADFCASQHLLERTAARRLKAQGWSFSEVLDDYRRYRAQDLLGEPALGLAEVSDRLGYGDVQSFARACQRWFGCAPGGYRERLPGGPVQP
ncbi:MAG: helix-turn-helix domain-containing protein [Pseudomonas sp.]